MSLRRVVYQVMMLAPIWLMAALGLYERTYQDDYQFPALVPREHDRVTAYVDIMRRSKPLLALNLGSHHPEHDPAIVELAREWIRQAEAGKLESLHPAFHGDTMREGVKSDILSSKCRLTSYLVSIGRRLHGKGRAEEAAGAFILALRMGEVAKYSDLTTVSASNLQQRAALEHLETLLPELDPQQLEPVRQALADHEARQKRIEPIVLLVRRQYATYRAAKGEPVLPIEDVPADSDETHHGRTLLASGSEDLPVIANQVRVAIGTQTAYVRSVQRLLSSLKG
ncbi:MAG TPA: hypothetical protein VM328_13040 [Fimbriimonadaceae bacterium]|nr:hypothetical protein [Fimbriimonadaceae bacterium]